MAKKQLVCPKCKTPVHCGCGACRKRHGNQPGMMIPIKEIECDACPTCGFYMHLDQWLDEEYKQLRA